MLGASWIKGILSSDIAKYGAIVLAFLAWTAYQRGDAAREARTELRAEVEAENAAEIARQIEAAQKVAEDARQRAEEQVRRAEEIQREADAIIEELQSRPLDDCDIPPDLREWLRNLAPSQYISG